MGTLLKQFMAGVGGGRSWSSYWATQRNTDEVECAYYGSLLTSANVTLDSNFGTEYLNRNNITRIRQSGNLTKVQFYYGLDAQPTYAYVQIWRHDGSNYNLVGESDITSQIPGAGTHSITLTTPLAVSEGDFISIWARRQALPTGSALAARTSLAATSCRWKSDVAKPETLYDWDSQTSATFVISIKAYMQAPLIVAIGDSIIAGHSAHYSYCEASLVSSIESSMIGQLNLLRAGLTCQNMGIGSQTSTQVAARFATDVVALKPKIAIINGGVNDIAGGTITKETFLSNYATMLDACVAASIKPVICKILPWTDGTNEQMQTRDDWMTDLQFLVATYNGAVWVDFDTAIGKNRVDGDVGNLWDIQTTPDYDDDGVHLTALGYAKMAEVIDTAIRNS